MCGIVGIAGGESPNSARLERMALELRRRAFGRLAQPRQERVETVVR